MVRIGSEIIDGCKAGDVQAVTILVAALQTPLYQLAIRILGDRAEAEDAVQEIFIRLLRSISDYRGNAQFTTWVYRLAVNLCLDHNRKRKRSGEIAGIYPGPAQENEPERALLEKERQETIRKAMLKLPAQYRAAVTLHYLEDFSYQEIAEIMNMPRATVGTWIYRGKTVLREELKALGKGDEDERMRRDQEKPVALPGRRTTA